MFRLEKWRFLIEQNARLSSLPRPLVTRSKASIPAGLAQQGVAQRPADRIPDEEIPRAYQIHGRAQ